ncbi:MAG TPA: magnesium transporter [Bacteroidales bacterium]|nr:magnesium transporter [Bacteroidales bacterium]
MNFELTRDYVERLREVVEARDEATAVTMLRELHAADIAEIYASLTIEEARFLYLLLEGEKASDVLAELEEDDREEFLRVLPSEVIAEQFIHNMDSDDAADVIADLSEEKKEEVLQYLKDVEQAGDIVDLLSYDEDTAGGLMAKELIRVNENWNIMTALKEMRKQAGEVDEVFYVYVVDDDGILHGTLSLKKLLLATPQQRIKGLYKPDVISVRTNAGSEEVASIMSKYDLVVLPVVDSIGRLMGRITIDDIVDVIQEEAERDYQMASGISADVEPTDSPWMLTRARIPWLLIGLLGGIFVALVISRFETDIKINPQMAFFIPLIAAMAGNVGIQSSAIIVQSIAANTPGIERTARKLAREFLVALMNGVVLGGLIFVYNFFTTDTLALTFTVSLSLFGVIMFASLFGTLIPLLLHKVKLDPALATGPFITTMNDIMGLVIYFLVGRMMYGIF